MHIEILEKDSSITGNNSTYQAYIDDLRAKLTFLNDSYNSLKNSLPSIGISSDSINIIRSKLMHFINNIKIETPDKQSLMLKEFVKHIRYNLANDVVEINVIIASPETSSEIIFDKHLFSSY